MRVKSLKVVVRVLVFGMLLGASSTAYADAVVMTSFSSSLQFTPAAGTAVFTPTGASARGQATNSLGQTQDITSNLFPIAQSTALVTFASSSTSVNATNLSANAISFVNVGGCTCTASSFGIGIFTGTLVILGGEGNVDVTVSTTHFGTGQVATDQFGTFAFAEIFYNLLVNGRSVLSQDQMLIEVEGPNRTGGFQLGPGGVSRVFSVQFGAVNTIEFRMGDSAAGANANEIPEPATIVLLVSGLGFMTGVLRKRRTG